MSQIQSNVELNCEGLNCPLPILKTKKTIDGMQSGQVLKLTATDPGSVNDMASWANRTGNELMAHTEAGGVHTFFIMKK
ncbi:MAG: sulfurtransferase TusA family protein [Chlorobiaceae bacterium]|nr:sulfurtransferase TusA family protein [Chlorobiales bacterium]NTU90982.1 sulfurtransferase TusA family protein [Chlorobiaceae bacterium]NTV25955.1 sulfurtransferase TusA family protein [Chlorobiaceae bacterium]